MKLAVVEKRWRWSFRKEDGHWPPTMERGGYTRVSVMREGRLRRRWRLEVGEWRCGGVGGVCVPRPPRDPRSAFLPT